MHLDQAAPGLGGGSGVLRVVGMARSIALALALTVGAVGCGDDTPDLSAWCGLVASGDFVPLDALDAAEAWRRLEASAPSDLRADVERVRVAADQVAELQPGELTSAAHLVLTAPVLSAHGRVVDAIRSRCRIDVADMSVIETASTSPT